MIKESRFFLLLGCLAFITTIAACSNEEKERSVTSSEVRGLTLTEDHAQVEVSGAGIVEIGFTLKEPKTSAQLIAELPGARIQLVRLSGPRNQTFFDAAKSFDSRATVADSLQKELNVFTFPIAARDDLEDLPAGEYQVQYQVDVLAAGEPVPHGVLAVTIVSKDDDDITTGNLPVRVFISDVLNRSSDAMSAIESSIEIAREILLSSQIQLQIEYISDARVPETLPNPGAGDELYRSISSEYDPSIFLYIGNRADGLRGPLNAIAQAGSIPGAFVSTSRTAIVVSYSAAAGSDGILDSEIESEDPHHTSEARLFGEALAHEILQYLGLQDSVVIVGNSIVATDVTDSPKCPNLEACRYDDKAPHNIMFPFSLTRKLNDGIAGLDQDNHIPRDRLSTLQELAVNLAIGIE